MGTVSEIHESSECRDGDHESEDVIQYGVNKAIDKTSPVHVFDTLEFIVNVKLRGHHNKPEDGNKCHCVLQQESVDGFYLSTF